MRSQFFIIIFYCFYFSLWILEDIKKEKEQGISVLSLRKEILWYIYTYIRAGTTGLKTCASWLAAEGERRTSGHKLHAPGEEQLFTPSAGTWRDTLQDKPTCARSSHVETLQAQQHGLQGAHEAGGKPRSFWSWHTSPGGSRWTMLVIPVVKREVGARGFMEMGQMMVLRLKDWQKTGLHHVSQLMQLDSVAGLCATDGKRQISVSLFSCSLKE